MSDSNLEAIASADNLEGGFPSSSFFHSPKRRSSSVKGGEAFSKPSFPSSSNKDVQINKQIIQKIKDLDKQFGKLLTIEYFCHEQYTAEELNAYKELCLLRLKDKNLPETIRKNILVFLKYYVQFLGVLK